MTAREGGAPAGASTVFSALLERSLDAIVLMDASGAITHFNAAAERVFGYSRADVLGRMLADTIIPPALRERHREGLRRYLESGQGPAMGKRLELVALRSDGREFPIELTIEVCKGHGALVFVGWVRDISARVLATRRLEALADLATSLAGAQTRREVARVIVDCGRRAAGADVSTLHGIDDSGNLLELLAERGVDPEGAKRLRRVTGEAPDRAALAALRSRQTLWAEDEASCRAALPSLAPSVGPRTKTLFCAPLVVGEQAVGVLSMAFCGARQSVDRAFVDTLAKQCGQALLGAMHFERQRDAHLWRTATLQSVGDGVIATDADGRVAFMNPVAERLTGWPEAQAHGRPIDEVFSTVSEETGAPVESPVARVLRQGTVVGLANRTRLRARSGAEVPIADSGAPIRDEDGRLFGVVLVVRDATEETQAADRQAFLLHAGAMLNSSTLDYHETLSRVAQLVVPRLADWCAVHLLEPGNLVPKQVAVAHVDPAKVELSRRHDERYPCNVPAGVYDVIRTGKSKLHRDLRVQVLEATAFDAEHLADLLELKLESVMIVPLRGRQQTFGTMTFVYAASGRRYSDDDLTFAEEFARRAALAIENAKALKDAAEARAAAEAASRAKDEFLGIASHELRTPLHAIVGRTALLRSGHPPASVERGLSIIERNARRQMRLVDDILDVSRIMSGKLTLAIRPVNVSEVMATCVEAVKPAADAKSITIRHEGRDRDLIVLVDPDRLQQVVWNLLANALKFSPIGSVIVVRSTVEGQEVVLAVADQGEGIEPEALPHIFEPFRQADLSTTRRHGGLGLGLAIASQLVAAHGGTVSAESPGPGRGATFTVRLPARDTTRAAAARGAGPGPSLWGGAPSIAPIEQVARLDGLKLLVVDDEPDARDLTAEVLRTQGAEVETAASAIEALAVLERARPDVLVSDIEMPDVDGYALLRKLRSLPPEQGGRTPAVALTAYARTEDAEQAFAAGYQRHVAKPLEPAELAAAVANLGGKVF